MSFVLTAVVLLLLHCQTSRAGFCSEDELAGECFDNKIKPMAFTATAAAFILGISTILLATALLCKAKRRQKAKIMVYRQPYEKSRTSRTARENRGFESTSQYHVKRPIRTTAYDEPMYIVTRNASKTNNGRVDAMNATFAGSGEEKRPDSAGSSGLLWVAGNGNGNGK